MTEKLQELREQLTDEMVEQAFNCIDVQHTEVEAGELSMEVNAEPTNKMLFLGGAIAGVKSSMDEIEEYFENNINDYKFAKKNAVPIDPKERLRNAEAAVRIMRRLDMETRDEMQERLQDARNDS